jgi:PAS domain S-box-containing protein
MSKRFNNGSVLLTSRYLLALLAPLVITGAMQITWPLFESNPLALYLLSVMLCAWYGGLGPGLLCVVVSFLLSDLFFVEPYSLFQFHKRGDVVRVVLFIIIGPAIGVLSELMHRERRRRSIALNALRVSEERYRKLAENFPNGAVITYDRDLRVTFIAGRGLQEAGFSPDHFLGKSLSEITPPEVETLVETYFQTAFAGQLVTFECPYPDGRTYFAAVAPLVNGKGLINEILVISQDITERKRIEEKLRQSESQLAEAQKLASVGSWNWEIQNKKNTWSEELYRICGLDPKETQPSYEAFIQLVHPDDRDGVRLTFKQTLLTKQPIDCYVRIIRPDGAGRIIHSRGNAISDMDGTPIRMHGIVQDVTENKQAEDALGEAERKYRSIFENAVEGIFQTTADGRFISANPALARMLGFDSPEELKRVRTNIAHDHYVNPQSREEFKRSIEENGFVFNFELEAYRKDHSKIWFSENVRAVRDEQGSVLYYEGTAEDITDRKRAQESLTLFRNLIDQSSDAIEVLEPNTLRFLDCNATAHQVLGYSREEFLALTAFDIDPVIDQATPARLNEELAKSGSFTFESVHRRKDGSTFPVEINAKNIRLERNYRLAVVRDITDRKRAEAALRDAERKYRDMFENAGEGIFQSTPDGKFLVANPALAHMYGFASPEELIHGRPDISQQIYVDPARREDFKRLLEEQGVVRDFECQIFRKDESKIWISMNARGVRDEKGEIQYFEGTAQDITDRKRAEEALRKSEERYRDLVENSLDLICTHDLDGWVLSANRAAMELMGYASGTYNGGINFRQILAPEVRDQFDAYLVRIRNDGVAGGLMLVQTTSGEQRIWEYHCTLRTKGIAAPIVRGVARDVTERRRAAAALRDSEARYRELFENARDAIYVHDLRGVYTSVNRAAEKLSGYDRSEIIGKHFNHFIAPEYLPLVRANMSKKLTEKGETAYEIEVVSRDGHRVPVELSTALLLEHGTPIGIQGIARDITERKRAEEALRSYSRKLIEGQEAERQHIARELHDQIGQVLTAIRINLHTIGNSGESEELKSLVDQGVGLVDGAIDQVRNLSFELRPSLLDNLGLAAALRWYSDQYTQRTGIRTKSASSLPEGKIRLGQELETACFRIVQEALTNVVRHANAENVLIDLRQVDHKIVLSIKDDGIGFRAPTNGEVTATQLGLRGMKERALALGGALKIKSQPAQGTEIRATFPTFSKED